jgi:hypothetical protein
MIWLLVIVGSMMKQIGYFAIWRFILEGLMSPHFGGGEIKIIDPITLQVIASGTLPERVSWSRVGVIAVSNNNHHIVAADDDEEEEEEEEEDAIILMGDEHVFQLRWNIPKQQLYWVIMIIYNK